ncbi:Protein of unknown function [Bradyrhizobium vignae]|uniref:Uncharacterized protein n=1 Tax=Bradyrhizobium vignae TaxID=1549949 RepID=A0A2U3Q9F8_9BRAD|nr:Protein of unknown function [Bradyrhizobium vignae]
MRRSSVAHYHLCRVRKALRTMPAKALALADKAWSVAQFVGAALSVAPALRRRQIVAGSSLSFRERGRGES